jgi:hypothetical protein
MGQPPLREGLAMIRPYQTIFSFAVLLALAVFILLILAAFGYVSDLAVGGVSLWPVAMVAAFASFFVGSWAYAKAKGRSGWLGVLLPLLDIVGLKILQQLEPRGRAKAPRRG